MKYCSYRIGIIVDISDIENDNKNKFVTIAKKPKDFYSFTRLVVSKETLILYCEYNEISVDDLKDRVDALETKVSSLITTVDSHTQLLTNIQAQLESLSGNT